MSDSVQGSRLVSGLAFAVLSATTFSLAGPLARGMLISGWSPGAVVLIRVTIAALAMAPFGAFALRGRWDLLRRNLGLLLTYGLAAVAGAQFCYFSAVARMQAGPALLIEYTAPAVVVFWFWWRHGHRPGVLTLVGAGIAAVGLVLVLDLLSGADLSFVGVLWALGAMVGAVVYFVLSADERNGLPPMVLAAGGMAVAAVGLAVLGLVGALEMHGSTAPVTYSGTTVAWWVPLVVLGVVAAAVPYTAGIAAGRRLGARLASFVALLEVLSTILFGWLLLGELPHAVQLLGGLLVLAGVVAVKLGEPVSEEPAGLPAV